MYDNNETVHVDIEEFAAHIAKVRTDTLYDEQRESEEEENYDELNDDLNRGLYYEAFECAQNLRVLDFSKYKDIIISCYKTCSENDVAEAMLELVRLLINRKTLSVKPEAFPYIRRLSELGYIESFRWLGDCYYYGLGCEKDLKKASHSYFEAYLFDGYYACKEKLRQINADLELYSGIDPVKCLLKALIFKDDRLTISSARDDIAMLMLQGKIKEYTPEDGYIVLRRDWSGGITRLRLGKCLLRGRGTKINPAVAQYVLEYAEWDLEDDFNDIVEDETLTETEKQILENEYEKAQKEIFELQEEAEYKIRELQEKEGFLEDDEAIEDWENEKVVRIRRNVY